jgi:putrescine transport system substrate-binding protein
MPMNAPSRSSPILGLVRTLLLTGCNGGKGPQEPATSAAPRESRVYNRAVYIDLPIPQQFEAETAIRIVSDTVDSNALSEPKRPTGRSGHDIVVPSAHLLERPVKAGVLRPLDRAKLPNAWNLDLGIMATLARHDAGNVHALADRGVAVVDAPTEVIGSVFVHLGREPNAAMAEDLAAVAVLPMTLRPSVRYISAPKITDDLASGEIGLAKGGSGM